MQIPSWYYEFLRNSTITATQTNDDSHDDPSLDEDIDNVPTENRLEVVPLVFENDSGSVSASAAATDNIPLEIPFVEVSPALRMASDLEWTKDGLRYCLDALLEQHPSMPDAALDDVWKFLQAFFSDRLGNWKSTPLTYVSSPPFFHSFIFEPIPPPPCI
jgi:hypothetical protein